VFELTGNSFFWAERQHSLWALLIYHTGLGSCPFHGENSEAYPFWTNDTTLRCSCTSRWKRRRVRLWVRLVVGLRVARLSSVARAAQGSINGGRPWCLVGW